MSGDWLGLGEDATVNQFDINPQSGVADTKQGVIFRNSVMLFPRRKLGIIERCI